jgi:hypothetical protein
LNADQDTPIKFSAISATSAKFGKLAGQKAGIYGKLATFKGSENPGQ